MADDIQVRFGGDAAGIRAAADQAKGTIQGFATTAPSQNATARQSYDELKAAIDAANAALRQIQASAENTSTLARRPAPWRCGHAYEGLRGPRGRPARVRRDRPDLRGGWKPPSRPPRPRPVRRRRTVEFASNALSASRALDVTALSTQGLTGAIERQRSAFQEWRRGSQIYGSGLLEVEGRTIAAAGNMDRLQAAAQARGFENHPDAPGLPLELTKVPGMTDQGAASIEAMLASVPNYTGSANASIVSLIAMMASSEDEAKQMASSLTAAMRRSRRRRRAVSRGARRCLARVARAVSTSRARTATQPDAGRHPVRPGRARPRLRQRDDPRAAGAAEESYSALGPLAACSPRACVGRSTRRTG